MIKFQTNITLTSIQYIGKTIGREFAIKLNINGKKKTLNKLLIPNSVNKFDDLIYTDSLKSAIDCNIAINAIEKDSNPDEGSTNLLINISPNTNSLFQTEVSIIENGAVNNNGNECKLRFIFKVSTIELGIKTLVEVDEKGWINGKLVKKDGSYGDQISLPYGLMVEHYKTEAGKEYFKILEGKYKGKKARLLIPNNKKTRLKSSFKYKSACKIDYIYKNIINNGKYDFVTGEVKVNGIATSFKAFSFNDERLSAGEYYLEIPDEPHPKGASYEKYSLFSKSWFRIKYPAKPKSAYYLHLGRASDGCITVYAPDVNPADTWTKIYNQIVTCRVEGMPGIIGKVRVINEIK